MLFTNREIQQILDIIKYNHVYYIAQVTGIDTLTTDDKKILRQNGIEPDAIKPEWTQMEKAYHFGRLANILRDNQVRNLNYNDFLSYLSKGQYIPLNNLEKQTVKYLNKKSYAHIKNLESTVTQGVNNIILKEDNEFRSKYEEIIRDSLKRGAEERKSVNDIVRDIGKKTGDWGRDLGRIVETESQNAYEYGKANIIKRRKGKDKLVWKQVYPGACKWCIQAYLTNGIGSKPRLFKLSTLENNGTNIGVKPKDWKPIIGAHHPHCRCDLREHEEGTEWDEEVNDFVYKKKSKEYLGYKVKVGDKEFKV